MATPTYNPKRVTVNYKGNIITGFESGTMISVSRNQPVFTLKIGSDGEAMRVRSADESGTVTLTLQAQSDSNDILSAALTLDSSSNSNLNQTGALLIADLNGNTLVSIPDAFITKWPDLSYSGDDAGPREWEFTGALLSLTVGSIG